MQQPTMANNNVVAAMATMWTGDVLPSEFPGDVTCFGKETKNILLP